MKLVIAIKLALKALLVASGIHASPPAAFAPTSSTYPAVMKYYEEARAHGQYPSTKTIDIEFRDLGTEKEHIDCTGRKITIDVELWEHIPESFREATIFHVLSHCLLGRGHRDGDIESESGGIVPTSLMDSRFVSGQVFLADRERYLKELFNAPFLKDSKYP